MDIQKYSLMMYLANVARRAGYEAEAIAYEAEAEEMKQAELTEWRKKAGLD